MEGKGFKKLRRGFSMIMKDSAQARHFEPLWPVVLAILAVIGLLVVLPGRITLFPILIFLSPLISLLPLAALAAIVVVIALPLLSPAGFRSIMLIRRTEFWWALAACVGVVLLGTLQGILVVVAISVLTLLHQATYPLVYAVGRKPGTEVFRPLTGEHPEDETLPGLLILLTEGWMNFASAPQVGERMWALIRERGPWVVILECSAVPDLEYTALRALTAAEEKLRAAGITLWLSTLNPEALKVVEHSPLGRTLGHERMFFNLREAVKAYEARVEKT
ncbi:MAG: STAS domain-containing protein, partial [Anaerolineales bacterium]|nr:STAS domain-containing protein [Anaerolineales bacterium]